MGKRILLVGATGLVGQGVLAALLQAPDIDAVSLLVRRPYPGSGPKLQPLLAPGFTREALAQLDLRAHDACLYCAGPLPLGMTEAAYREATVATLARVVEAYAAANPQGYVAYVSGAGADAGSRLMPLKVKGEAENLLAGCGLAYTCLRPGVVRPRPGASSPHRLRRIAYALCRPLLALSQALLPGAVTSTEAIGQCMLQLVRAGGPRPSVIDNAGIASARDGL